MGERKPRPFRDEVLRRPALVAWFGFVATLPFYLGASGLPQPGNALVLIALPLALRGWNRKVPPHSRRLLGALAWFTVWTAVVNLAWAALTGKWLSVYTIVPLYYVFNTLVVLCALVLYKRWGDAMLRATLYGVLFDIAFQVAASFVYKTDYYRGELFFNNPNQLGYWALLAGCLIALTQARVGLGLLRSSVGLTGCAYLAVLSASRAALAGIVILLVFLVFTNPRVLVLSTIAAIGLLVVGGPLANAIDSTTYRTQARESVGFAEERGYDRMWRFPEYMVLGAGEGDVTRFVDDPKKANEIHSSIGTVVFSYGILGTVLFLTFFVRLLRPARRRTIMFFVPVLAYAIAHQGLRFALFWVLIGVFAVLDEPVAARQPERSARYAGKNVSLGDHAGSIARA